MPTHRVLAGVVSECESIEAKQSPAKKQSEANDKMEIENNVDEPK